VMGHERADYLYIVAFILGAPQVLLFKRVGTGRLDGGLFWKAICHEKRFLFLCTIIAFVCYLGDSVR